MQEHTGDDLSDLYLEERDHEIRAAADEKRRQQMLVPGLLGPHELMPIHPAYNVNEDMQD